MGEEIRQCHFSPEDFKEFGERLREETRLLQSWFEKGSFVGCEKRAGFELEAWLVDRDFLPSPKNEEFLQSLGDEAAVPELSRFNVEFNGTPRDVKSDLLEVVREELDQTFAKFESCAQRMDDHIVTVGILPSLKDEMLTLENMSSLQRYSALNEQVLRLRHFKPLKVDIVGYDHIVSYHRDVMLESCTTSLQVHLQIEHEQALRFYNAALIVSPFTVAVAANSPFLFGRELWEETRIPLFEQSVDLESFRDAQDRRVGRVTFGSGYLKNSLMECFQENLEHYPVMLPTLFSTSPEKLSHLSLHNGTIWRWNRPLVGFDQDGHPQLRIEHRVMAASPSRADSVADLALFLGLMQKLATRDPAPETQIPFSQARQNFYNAAREGLNASVVWWGGHQVSLKKLLLDELLPLAHEGLLELGICGKQVEDYLDGIITERIRSGRNGSWWQKAFIHQQGRDFPGMTRAYSERQRQGRPIHEWSL